jgi:hypothetical protein
MGETVILFLKVMFLICRGEKSAAIGLSFVYVFGLKGKK